ncbi:MAG: hypothetical protein UC961_02510 [Emergencia sp.]|nr:hypothetical protein [Emergencia sp.]
MANNETQTAVQKECRLLKFLRREHTPAEKGIIIGAAALAGAAAGIFLLGIGNGIQIEISIGSHNGCNNQIDS